MKIKKDLGLYAILVLTVCLIVATFLVSTNRPEAPTQFHEGYPVRIFSQDGRLIAECRMMTPYLGLNCISESEAYSIYSILLTDHWAVVEGYSYPDLLQEVP